ncbi:MAG: type VI secretion system baseplate subunit TssK [Gemmatimonadetes bacterium]|nr:type VI secretion system baseplate subunit TssK [Gemmatimonadota bacterium]
MKLVSRVVWSEGMHLAQHHFQAQSGYFESLTGFAVANLFFKPYGVAGLELDAEALLNGVVSLTHARGLMPDGMPFHFPEDPAPEPLDIRELFSPTHDSHVVLLTIPAERPGRANCALGEAAPDGLRYRAEVRAFPDDLTGADEKPVLVAQKNFRLVLDEHRPEDVVALPIARVRRDGSGHFIYDPRFVPPSLQIGASVRLMELTHRLIEILEAKASSIQAERRETNTSLADFASKEIANFWLAHAIHSALSPLRYLLQTRSAHPERLYVELARLAGALCTFSLTSSPRDLPAYDHDDLERTFDALERHVLDHLDLVVPTNCIRIPLTLADQGLFTGAVVDRRALGRARWYLGVRSTATASEVIARVPKLIKICSAKHIVRLVREAYPGLTLEHVPSPPAELSPKIGAQYFAVQTAGPCWASISETAQLGIYVPAAIPDVELDIAVIVEG